MNYRFLITAVASMALALAPSAAFAKNSNSSTNHVSQSQKMFLRDMAHGNVAEIELGQLAAQKGSNQTVRDFGTRMVKDHTMLNDQLKQTASQLQVSLPTQPTAQQTREKAKLERLSGKNFDKQYMSYMLKEHRMDVQKVRHEAENATNPQVKKLAQDSLPTLEQHLQLAQNDAGKLGISASSGAGNSAQR